MKQLEQVCSEIAYDSFEVGEYIECLTNWLGFAYSKKGDKRKVVKKETGAVSYKNECSGEIRSEYIKSPYTDDSFHKRWKYIPEEETSILLGSNVVANDIIVHNNNIIEIRNVLLNKTLNNMISWNGGFYLTQKLKDGKEREILIDGIKILEQNNLKTVIKASRIKFYPEQKE